MKNNQRIYDRFMGYTLSGYDCRYCLYFEKSQKCRVDICCCWEEIQAALEHEAKKKEEEHRYAKHNK